VFLTAREVNDLASWSSEPRLIQFAAFTGLRLGELLALRDGEADLHEGCVVVVRAARKGVEGRTKTRPTPTGLVFPSPRSDGVWNSDNFRADVFAKAVKRAAQKAAPGRREDVARLEFHDLRHTFASLMIAAGANALQIAEALGSFRQNGPPRPDTRLEAIRPSISGLDARGHRSTRPPPRRPRPLAARDIRGMENGARAATWKKSLQIETGATGLEPATSGVTGRRSNQLNYAPRAQAL
jgi:hypothetical protein